MAVPQGSECMRVTSSCMNLPGWSVNWVSVTRVQSLSDVSASFADLGRLLDRCLGVGAQPAGGTGSGLVPGHARWKEGPQPAAAKPFRFAFSPDSGWRELWKRYWSEKQVRTEAGLLRHPWLGQHRKQGALIHPEHGSMALWWKWGAARGEPWALHSGIMRQLIQEGTSPAWQTSSSFSSRLCCGTCFPLQPLFWLHALKPAPWRGLWQWSQPPFTTLLWSQQPQ